MLEQTWSERLQDYVKPVFGYALNRTGNRQTAEDLTQEIFLQLLKTLASGTSVNHLEAYVWTVARYTWINWLKHKGKHSIVSNGLPEFLADGTAEPLDQLVYHEAFDQLRREIAYLSELQRRILVMHYYDGLKQREIAAALNLPVGTVKWHLHEARRELKKGMNLMRVKGELSFNPISFAGMGHTGQPGPDGETGKFLRSAISQNIVYAAYHKPVTVHELADELGTPPPFIEDEVRYLAEYDFLTEVSPGKFQTNMILWNTTREQLEETYSLYKECAAEVADLHFQALMDVRRSVEETGIYYPDKDYNFLLWTLLPKNIGEQGAAAKAFELKQEEIPLRKDGGRYIATATIAPQDWSREELPFDLRHYEICGPMVRNGGGELALWQLDTYWSNRPGWKHLHFQDAELCHAFWKGDLRDETASNEQLSLLLAKQYVLKQDKGYSFNAVWIDHPDIIARLRKVIPDLSKEYRPIVSRIHEKMYEITMRNKPKHIAPQVDYMSKINAFDGQLIPYILTHLIDRNLLQPPKPHQSKTITTLVGLIH